MTIIELMQKIGAENITFQRLDQSLSNITTNKKGVSKITFETNAITANDVFGMSCGETPPKIGLIVWIPKGFLPSAQADVSPVADGITPGVIAKH